MALEKKNFIVDHYPANVYHTGTGIFVLWESIGEDLRVDLVDWALYTPNEGEEQAELAFQRITETAIKYNAVLDFGRHIK